ncbi:MAG TPA: glutaredoxin family protein [Thioploca sp.]|nr:glutaredoxin family protein [Thioploca sp.]
MIDRLALTLYTRVGCHLCDEMKQQLNILQQQYEFSLNLVDVDADSYLKLRYGERIPVLAIGEREICHYHLNNELLMECFK